MTYRRVSRNALSDRVLRRGVLGLDSVLPRTPSFRAPRCPAFRCPTTSPHDSFNPIRFQDSLLHVAGRLMATRLDNHFLTGGTRAGISTSTNWNEGIDAILGEPILICVLCMHILPCRAVPLPLLRVGGVLLGQATSSKGKVPKLSYRGETRIGQGLPCKEKREDSRELRNFINMLLEYGVVEDCSARDSPDLRER